MTRTLQEKRRLGVMLFFVLTFFAIVSARLVHLQVVLGKEYGDRVRNQSEGQIEIPPRRGEIYDRHGRVVASTVRSYSLYAYPRDNDELREVGRFLDDFLGLPRGRAIKEKKIKVHRFRWISRKLNDAVAIRLMECAPPGLFLRHEPLREYPFGLVGRQILGFTDIDHMGQAGIELAYDSLLGGVKGVADYRRDGLARTYRVKEAAMVQPVNGRSLVLTVDWRFQEIVEQELQKAVVEHNATSGQACFVDCRTGEILAMAHYDPREKYPHKPYKARVVTDLWEPGSVYKIVAASAMLDAELVNWKDTVYCENGKWRMGRRWLHDDKKHEWLDHRRIIELSSNIGLAKTCIPLGGDKILETSRKFGFGKATNIGLPSEASGKLPTNVRWSDYNIAAFSIGHSVATTTLQMTMAMAATGNDGVRVRPQLIYGFVNRDGKINPIPFDQNAQRIMKSSSADSLKSLLRGVVERGTAEVVNSPVVSIAGKTGTAQIFDTERNRYFRSRYMASFGGFFPVDEPLVAGLVVLEAPKPVHYGGLTAGPAFREMVERYALCYPERFSPGSQLSMNEIESTEMLTEVPDLVGRDFGLAQEMADRVGIEIRGNRDGGKVVWQFPPPDRLVVKGEPVLVAVEAISDSGLVMADVRGLPVRMVSAFLDFAGVKTVVDGNGRVRRQSITPGNPLSGVKFCRLTCRPS